MEGNCYLCGEWHQLETHHMVGGNGRRAICDRYGLTVEICRNCHRAVHDSGFQYHELHEKAELKFLNDDWDRSINMWVKLFGKNYIYD